MTLHSPTLESGTAGRTAGLTRPRERPPTRGSQLPAIGLLASALLTGCGGSSGVNPFLDRPILWGPEQRTVDLSVGKSVDVPVRICPAIRSYEIDQDAPGAVSFQPGRYQLAVENLPPDVSATFLEGASHDVPEPDLVRRGFQYGLGWAGNYSAERYCWQQTLRLARGQIAGALPARELQLRLTIRYENGALPALAADETRREAITLTLVDAAAGAPPVTGATCTAGTAVAGRWVDALPAPPALQGAASGELDATLVQDRPLLARVARVTDTSIGFDGFELVADEWVGDAWRRSTLRTVEGADQVRVAAWRDRSNGDPVRMVAWRSVNYGAPREQQARVRAAWVNERGEWAPLPVDAGFGLESELRSLQLAAWQGQPVVAWLRPTGLVLQRFDGSAWQSLVSPFNDPFDGTTRQLRLRVDPVDDTLVLAFAGVDADGVTRLRAWRLARPDAAWIALPALDAGAPQGLFAGLAAFTLDALGGSTTLAWSYGQVSFSSASQLAMSVQRIAPNATAWTPLGDARTLSAPSAGYAVQPVTMSVAASCSGGAYLAWHEPGNYPEGRIAGAQWAADSGWDPFGRVDLATLPNGRGTYAADLRLLTASDGRPLLVASLQPGTGGPAQVVLRRHAP